MPITKVTLDFWKGGKYLCILFLPLTYHYSCQICLHSFFKPSPTPMFSPFKSFQNSFLHSVSHSGCYQDPHPVSFNFSPLFSSPFPQIIFFSAFPSSHSICFPAAACMLSSLQPFFSPSPPTMLSSSDLYLTSLPQTYLHLLDYSLSTILTYCIHSFQIILA